MDIILMIAVVAGIFIFLVALGIILKIFKKLLSFAFLILIVAVVIAGFSVYKDVQSFQNFNETSNIFLLMDVDDLKAGFVQSPDNLTFLDDEMVERHQRYINREKYEDVQGENYKAWFIDILVFEDDENFNILLEQGDTPQKSLLFSYKVADKLDGDMMWFFNQYKKKNIDVYPKTALFKFIDVIPTSLLKKVAEKIKVKATQEMENFIKNKAEEILE